jgi:hypothetical protein
VSMAHTPSSRSSEASRGIPSGLVGRGSLRSRTRPPGSRSGSVGRGCSRRPPELRGIPRLGRRAPSLGMTVLMAPLHTPSARASVAQTPSSRASEASRGIPSGLAGRGSLRSRTHPPGSPSGSAGRGFSRRPPELRGIPRLGRRAPSLGMTVLMAPLHTPSSRASVAQTPSSRASEASRGIPSGLVGRGSLTHLFDSRKRTRNQPANKHRIPSINCPTKN